MDHIDNINSADKSSPEVGPEVGHENQIPQDAIDFLRALDPDTDKFTFQTFDDNEERKKQQDAENKQRKKDGRNPLSNPFPVWPKKFALQDKLGSLCHSAWARRALSVTLFWAINGGHCEPAGKWGSSWSGHASWPTSAGRWTRSCCCGISRR